MSEFLLGSSSLQACDLCALCKVNNPPPLYKKKKSTTPSATPKTSIMWSSNQLSCILHTSWLTSWGTTSPLLPFSLFLLTRKNVCDSPPQSCTRSIFDLIYCLTHAEDHFRWGKWAVADTHLAWHQLSRAADYAEMQQLALKTEQATVTKRTRFGPRFVAFMAVRFFLRTSKILQMDSSFLCTWNESSSVKGLKKKLYLVRRFTKTNLQN